MGKQIRFFMDENDEMEFVNYIYSNGDVLIIDKVGVDGNIQIIKDPIELECYNYYLYSPGMRICIRESGFISETFSEVIEFRRAERKGNIMYYGRLWMEMKYWDENSNLVSKSPQLEKKYNLYKRYITKNYKLSQDKDFYIGPHAYDLYLKGEIKTMAGPVVEVKF